MSNTRRFIFMAVTRAPGCQEKRTRSVTLEGPEKKYELQLESTDKQPDAADEQ